MTKIYQQAFAHAGTKQVIPDASDPQGYVSNEDGFTTDYELPDTDPNYKPIERAEFNGLMNMVTEALGEIQQFGFAKWQALGGGWPVGATVSHGGGVWQSLDNANTEEPGTGATKWALVPTPALLQKAAYVSAVAAGTADALTGAFSPAITALPAAPGTLSVLVRASAANTSTAPTFAADGTDAKDIVKGNNLALAAGDIAGAGHWLDLQYDATLDKWVLQNPATGILQSDSVPPGTIIDFAGTSAPNGYLICGVAPTNLSRTIYAKLFAAIGTTWGAGDGSTTFGMPYFPYDYAAIQSSSNVGTISIGQVISHSHAGGFSAQAAAGANGGGQWAGLVNANTAVTGTSANYAAGVHVLKCVKY